jgi:hypothetical protein
MNAILKKIILILVFLPTLTVAQTWQVASSDKQIAVLELFSAEGCGNCPRAYRWIHDLPNQGITNNELIVLSFHVDYLNDSKGWIDRFSKPLFSARQGQLAQINLYKTMYTPEFFISGEVIHSWEKHAKDVIHAVNKFEPEAGIELIISKENNELIMDSHIGVKGAENRHYSQLYLAITESDIVSKVTGGDNAGTTFNHQNLVRKWLGPFPLDDSGETDVSTRVKIEDEWNLENSHVVALVQNLNDGFILQAIELSLASKKPQNLKEE